MADGYQAALIKGIIAALKGDAAFRALAGRRVYDRVPQRVVFPYVKIGDIDLVPFDTDGTTGAEIVFGIHVHSRAEDYRPGNTRVQDAIYSVLHRGEDSVTVAGHTLVGIDFATSTTTEDDDGKSWTGRMAFTVLIDN